MCMAFVWSFRPLARQLLKSVWRPNSVSTSFIFAIIFRIAYLNLIHFINKDLMKFKAILCHQKNLKKRIIPRMKADNLRPSFLFLCSGPNSYDSLCAVPISLWSHKKDASLGYSNLKNRLNSMLFSIAPNIMGNGYEIESTWLWTC